MKYVFTLVATWIILSLLDMPTPAYAAKDQAGLLVKLDNTSAKLVVDNNSDAIQKLTGFRVGVTQLDEKGKVGNADALALIRGVDQAIACILSLSVS